MPPSACTLRGSDSGRQPGPLNSHAVAGARSNAAGPANQISENFPIFLGENASVLDWVFQLAKFLHVFSAELMAQNAQNRENPQGGP